MKRTSERTSAFSRLLAASAAIAPLVACSAREPEVAQPEADATTEPVEPSSAPSDAVAPFVWPVPAGWLTETIPFPLGFAPTLPYAGVEELRFAPGMFKADSEERWTYAFVWWLHGDIAFDAAKLNDDLAAYFSGLSLAVEQREGFGPQEAAAVAQLSPAAENGDARWAGKVSLHDAFVSHARIELNVEARVVPCAKDRTVALFTISPQPADHEVWKQLATLRDAFRCSE